MKTNHDTPALAKYPPSVVKSIHDAKQLMNTDIQQHLVLNKLARKVGTNECTLKKGFKEIFQITVYQYLLNRRMEYAWRLITESSLKESIIAKECGFDTLSGFVTAFHKYFGKKPRACR
ncbi:MAG: helix-turn-helix-domain containing protein AraC type [Ferruginibacter sp.]|nr:helix-turn-helix-domain containing protein AraC type [Ferruginibacter sp.]